MYGYLHQGRVISFDAASGGYNLESVGLARTSRWGPVASSVPGLQVGDRVVLGATGVSRDNLVIIAKVGMTFPGIPDIPGLVAALAGKADDSEIAAILVLIGDLDTRLDVLEPVVSGHTGTLSTHAGLLTAHGTELTSQDGRIDALEARTGYVDVVPDVASRPTTGLFNGRAIYRSDKGFMEFYDLAATKWRVRGHVTVDALGDITDPVAGQTVLLTTDSMIYRYTGSAWLAVLHTAPGGGYAKYTRHAAQSNAFVAAQWTRQAFNIAVDTTPDVTANGSFNQFTFVRGGVWDVDASVRANITNVDPVRYLLGIFPGNTPGTGAYKVTTENEPLASSNSTNLNVRVKRRFAGNDVICIASNRLGNSGAGGGNNAASEASSTEEGWCQLTLRWCGP